MASVMERVQSVVAEKLSVDEEEVTPGASFRSMNNPSVYETTEEDLIKQPNFMGENYSMSEPVKKQSEGIEFLKNILLNKFFIIKL